MTDLNTIILNRIAAEQSAAKTHASVITYSDGSEQRIEHASAVQADNALRSYRPLIGKHTYISRTTGLKKTIVSCEVVAL